MEPPWTTDKSPKEATDSASRGWRAGRHLLHRGTRSLLCLGEKMVAKGGAGNTTGASTLGEGTERHLGHREYGGEVSLCQGYRVQCVWINMMLN